MRTIYEVEPIVLEGRDFRAEAIGYFPGRVGFGDLEVDPCIVSRGPRQMEHMPRPVCFLTYLRRGPSQAAVGDRSVPLGPGSLLLRDFTRPVRSVYGFVHSSSVMVAHEEVGFDPSRHASDIVIRADLPIGRMASGMIETLFERLPTAAMADAGALADTAVGLVSGLYDGADADSELAAVAEARRNAVARHIAAHIGDRSLDADAVAAAVGISRATLYRDLSGIGGFDRLVLLHRIHAALLHLAGDGRSERGRAVDRLAAAAEHCRFEGPEALRDAFLAQFGYEPGDIVGIYSPERDAGSAANEIGRTLLDESSGWVAAF